MPEPQRAPEQCEERIEILESIKRVVDQILALHQREIEAIAGGAIEELERMDSELDEAMDVERSLFERFLSHIEAHGCQRA